MTEPERIRELMLDNLFAVFNVRDPERRMEALARNYTDDVIWTEPDRTNEGREAMNARATELLDGLPGLVFTAAGPVRVSRDLGVLAFNMGAPEREPAVSGMDVAVMREGRIARLYTMLTAQVTP